MATHRVLNTGRLTLLPADAARLQILLSGGAAFELITGLGVEDDFCPFADALKFAHDRVTRACDHERGWWAPRLFVLSTAKRVIGLAGFKGPPLDGAVEIGYSVASAFQGQGLATEGVLSMTEHAFTFPDVTVVFAHTLPAPSSSTRVLEKCGFTKTGEAMDPGDGLVWRWERPRRR
jgi:ribosomal-protein-alanine N-acetyltransferase